MYDIHAMSKSEISVPLKIENNDCLMQLDTGCSLSLAPPSFIKEVCPDVTLKPTNVVLSTYTGETMHPLGEAFVNVEYSGSQKLIPSSKTLVHYDETLPLFLSCDTSSYGAGAVLSHQIDGQFRPVTSPLVPRHKLKKTTPSKKRRHLAPFLD